MQPRHQKHTDPVLQRPVSFTVVGPSLEDKRREHVADLGGPAGIAKWRKARDALRPFLRGKRTLHPGTHFYIFGDHRGRGATVHGGGKDGKLWRSTCPTHLEVFQNDAGARKWPVTREVMDELVQAFCQPREHQRKQNPQQDRQQQEKREGQQQRIGTTTRGASTRRVSRFASIAVPGKSASPCASPPPPRQQGSRRRHLRKHERGKHLVKPAWLVAKEGGGVQRPLPLQVGRRHQQQQQQQQQRKKFPCVEVTIRGANTRRVSRFAPIAVSGKSASPGAAPPPPSQQGSQRQHLQKHERGKHLVKPAWLVTKDGGGTHRPLLLQVGRCQQQQQQQQRKESQCVEAATRGASTRRVSRFAPEAVPGTAANRRVYERANSVLASRRVSRFAPEAVPGTAANRRVHERANSLLASRRVLPARVAKKVEGGAQRPKSPFSSPPPPQVPPPLGVLSPPQSLDPVAAPSSQRQQQKPCQYERSKGCAVTTNTSTATAAMSVVVAPTKAVAASAFSAKGRVEGISNEATSDPSVVPEAAGRESGRKPKSGDPNSHSYLRNKKRRRSRSPADNRRSPTSCREHCSSRFARRRRGRSRSRERCRSSRRSRVRQRVVGEDSGDIRAPRSRKRARGRSRSLLGHSPSSASKILSVAARKQSLLAGSLNTRR